MQVLIVDDEPVAQRILQSYLQQIPGLQLEGVCKNAVEAFSLLSKGTIDLLLLDINMPEISGIEFIKALKNPPLVIFTTAYAEYAVESYNLNAIDYLLKPVPFDRFLKAIDKAQSLLRPSTMTSYSAQQNEDQLLFVKTEGKLLRIDLTKLWMVESLKDYLYLHTDTGKILVLCTMQVIEEQLSHHAAFLRIGRSCIININYVREIEGNTVRVKDRSVTIGNTYRVDVFRVIERLKLLP